MRFVNDSLLLLLTPGGRSVSCLANRMRRTRLKAVPNARLQRASRPPPDPPDGHAGQTSILEMTRKGPERTWERRGVWLALSCVAPRHADHPSCGPRYTQIEKPRPRHWIPLQLQVPEHSNRLALSPGRLRFGGAVVQPRLPRAGINCYCRYGK